ncbi:hypothetical protein CHS0354_019210, partial [Potamilus streckersoni]
QHKWSKFMEDKTLQGHQGIERTTPRGVEIIKCTDRLTDTTLEGTIKSSGVLDPTKAQYKKTIPIVVLTIGGFNEKIT